MEELKKCNVCFLELAIDNFVKQKKHLGKLRPHCRECGTDKVRRYRKTGSTKGVDTQYTEMSMEKLLKSHRLVCEELKRRGHAANEV